MSDNQLRQATQTERRVAAESIVNRYAVMGTVTGVIPVPALDHAALTTVLMSLTARLSDLYGVPFSREAGRNVVFSFIGGAAPVVGGGAVARVFKLIPGLGTLGGMLATTAIGGSVTYAFGKVMIRHYESGGTMLNWDSRKVRQYYESSRASEQQTASDEQVPRGAPDNLQQISGIGPAFAKQLRAAGITTFAQLAAAEPEALAKKVAGYDPRIHDLLDWQKQARSLSGDR